MIIFIVIIYLYVIISIINTYHMLHFIIISYIYIDIDDILWYNIHHIMLWLPPVQAFCKSGVCQCARQPVKWSPKWRGGSILFQPCWTSNKTCPWFIHNRIHCVGDPSRLALKATFFVDCQRKRLLSQCHFSFPKTVEEPLLSCPMADPRVQAI